MSGFGDFVLIESKRERETWYILSMCGGYPLNWMKMGTSMSGRRQVMMRSVVSDMARTCCCCCCWALTSQSSTWMNERRHGSDVEETKPSSPRSRPDCWSRDSSGARFTKYLTIILWLSYYLTIMPELRSTYDGRLIYKTSHEECKAFLGYDSLGKS